MFCWYSGVQSWKRGTIVMKCDRNCENCEQYRFVSWCAEAINKNIDDAYKIHMEGFNEGLKAGSLKAGIVRCVDCTKWHSSLYGSGACEKWHAFTERTDYCSYGTRNSETCDCAWK